MTSRQERGRRWADSDWQDVACFIGPNADRFHAVWQSGRNRALSGKPPYVFGWSWPALLFGFAWFFYRKQWAVGMALLLMPLLLGYFSRPLGVAGAWRS